MALQVKIWICGDVVGYVHIVKEGGIGMDSNHSLQGCFTNYSTKMARGWQAYYGSQEGLNQVLAKANRVF